MEQKMRILFIGDSITECGRFEDSEMLGHGYVRLLHDYLVTTFPKKQIEIINKGVSGDRAIDLQERWEEDVLSQRAHYVSVSIGINDVWRQLDQPQMKQIYPDEYENILHKLFEKTEANLILMEPTIIEEKVDSLGNEKLRPYVEIIRKLSKKYHALLVPTHEVFLDYYRKGGTYRLTTDGVHMNQAGNMLMATTWLNATMSEWEKLR